MDLVEFLRARLGEDEHIAAAARGHAVVTYENTTSEEVEAYLDHFCRLPRTRAEIEAKRKTIEACAYFLHNDNRGLDPCAATVLELVALPYADHPDYRPEWKP